MSAVMEPAVSLGEGGSVAISVGVLVVSVLVLGTGGSLVGLDEGVALVGEGGSVVVMDELVDIVTVVVGESVGTIPELSTYHCS